MPSSISNSEPENTSGVGGRWVARDIPEQSWLTLLAVALAVVAVATVGWELRVRQAGYGPSLDDTPNLWAQERARAVAVRSEQVVFVGASRTLFDMDLHVFQEETQGGLPPIQLATVGSNPLIILEDLAQDPSYAGTTIVGIVPGLVAATGGPPVANPKKNVAHYHHWSNADRMELPLARLVDERLALINENLTLTHLLESTLGLPNRPEVNAPQMPGYMYTVDRSRQARMTELAATNPDVQHRIQQTWLVLFAGPRKPAVFTAAKWQKMMSDGWEDNLRRIKQSVASIQARGGKVIFSRLPSTGGVYELESQQKSRAAIWDRILKETGAPGIYFEDYLEFMGFSCFEWSYFNT